MGKIAHVPYPLGDGTTGDFAQALPCLPELADRIPLENA
jgi:hypothetical protein